MGGVAVEASLVLAAIPAIDSIAGLDGVVDRCRDALAPLTTDPGFVSWIALVAAAFVAVRVALGMWRASMRARAALVEPWLGDHSERDDFELVVLPTEELVAFGVSALRPQIVISRGLLEHLEPAHVEAVVEHEAAHHRLHHGAFLVVLAGCASAFGRLGFVYAASRPSGSTTVGARAQHEVRTGRRARSCDRHAHGWMADRGSPCRGARPTLRPLALRRTRSAYLLHEVVAS